MAANSRTHFIAAGLVIIFLVTILLLPLMLGNSEAIPLTTLYAQDGDSDGDSDSDGGSSDSGSGNGDENGSKNWTAHAPVWQVGDLWTYDVVLDAQALIDASEDLAEAELDLLYGSATLEVVGVEELLVSGEITPVYRMVTIANVVGDGRNFPAPILGTVDGYLTAGFTLTEYLRVGDLALIEYDKHMVMTFTAEVLFIEQTVDVADFVESGIYSPPLEFYDFPLSMNESWNIVTNLTKTYTGSSDVVTIPSEPEYFDQEWAFSINATGEGGFEGCENSTQVWQINSEGEVEEWRWWCPAVHQYANRWTTDIAVGGVNASMVLTGFQPAVPALIITVELSENSMVLNGEIDVLVNISNVAGAPISGKTGYIYLKGIQRISFSTDDNGSVKLRVAVGNSMDDTPTSEDWGTHGVVAYLHTDQVVGATTLTLEGSAIGGLLRQDANRLASQASAIMTHQGNQFESSVRY